jgi:LIM interaction domain (LID)
MPLYQDVMVVGEPTLMGGEFGEKDERLIARLENNQYDPNEQPDDDLGPGDTSVDHLVRTTVSHGSGPPMSMSFGSPSGAVALPQRGNLLRQCPTSSPGGVVQSSWTIDRVTRPPSVTMGGGNMSAMDKLGNEFE